MLVPVGAVAAGSGQIAHSVGRGVSESAGYPRRRLDDAVAGVSGWERHQGLVGCWR